MLRNTLIATALLALTPVLAFAAPVTGVKTSSSAMAEPAKTSAVKPMPVKTVEHHAVKKQAVSTHLKKVKPVMTKS